MLKVGLTGGIGSGKTAVSNFFKTLKVPVIDTDIITRQLVNENTTVLDEIAAAFGQTIIAKDGSLDRKNLAQIVFNDADKKRQLENILHPKIQTQVEQQLEDIQNKALLSSNSVDYCIIVIPLLFESERSKTSHSESDYHGLIDRRLVVVADINHRIQRIAERDKRTLDEIHAIIKSQVDDEIRISRADDVIDNNNDIKVLQSQISALDNKYRELASAIQ